MTKSSFFAFLIVLPILNISCSQVSEEITPLEEAVTIQKDTIFNIQDRDFVDMMITDSLLIFIANKDSTYFHVFNKNTLKPIINFGTKGNAQFEFNFRPLFLKQHYTNKDNIEVFNLLFNSEINLKNILEGNNIAFEIKSERLIEDLTVSKDIARLDSSILVGTGLSRPEGLFYIYNNKSKTKKWIDFNPKLKINEKHYDSVYYGHIEVGPDSQTIVYCPRFFNRILFYNREGELIKTLSFSIVKPPFIEKGAFGVSSQETIYSYQTYSTNNYIYVLRPHKSLDELIENISSISVEVLRLTWDGIISDIYELELNKMPTLFCVDETDEKMFFQTPIDSYTSKDNISEISIYNLEF